MKTKLFLLCVVFTLLFTYFSYTVAKEKWQKTDFDTTVKLQDHIQRRFDGVFSYSSLLGSVEITMGFCVVLALLAFLRKRWLATIGWLTVVPAVAAEVFGKLTVFHPGPPIFLHRSILPTGLPSFFIHTNFSYPSGHMTRTIFIITVFIVMLIFSSGNFTRKAVAFSFLIFVALIMGMTRVYLGEHWLSDVIGGSLLGAAAGFFASALILKGEKV